MQRPNIGDRAGAWVCVGTGGGCTAWTRDAQGDAFDSATDPDPLPCPMCEGSGYYEDGARNVRTCGGCDGSGAGIRCACGAEIVPSVARVTHTEGDAGSGDGEGLHTPETCCTYTPRDAWQIAGEYDEPLPGSVADFCEAFYESHGYCWSEVGQ